MGKITQTSFAVLAASVAFGSAASAQVLQSVELHGYMQNRFYANPSSSARMAVERVSLSVTGHMAENRTAYVELYFVPYVASSSTTYVESAYVDIPLSVGKIRVGKGRQQNFGKTPTYANRKTTQYGILPETFTQDRIVGVQYIYQKGIVDGGVSVYTDQRLGTRGSGDFPGSVTASDIVEHWADRDVPGSISGKMAVSLKAGVANKMWQAHISGATGGLNANNLADINAAYATPDNRSLDHNKYGIDATYTSGPFVLAAEGYKGKFSELGIKGYGLMVGYEPAGKRRYYVNHMGIVNDIAPIAGTPRTWNSHQTIFGVVQPLSKGLWVEANYLQNLETGAVKNDVLFFELFSAF